MQYSFKCNQETNKIIDTLNCHGIAFIPNFLTQEQLHSFRSSFTQIMDKSLACVKRRPKHPSNFDGKQAHIDPALAKDDGFPEYSTIFQDGLIKDIADTFFAPNKIKLNPEILLTHLHPSPTPILPWHFDRMQTLKFWIYLEDTTRDDGAFEYCPGTHWEGHYRAAYHMATGTPVRYIPNDIPEHRVQNPVAIEAKAGDLVIFDPDGFHRGGVVKPGHERKVVRADTIPLVTRRYSDRPFTAGWWLRSHLNLARWLKSASFRTFGEKTADTTQIREREK